MTCLKCPSLHPKKITHHTNNEKNLKLNDKINKCQPQDDRDVNIMWQRFESSHHKNVWTSNGERARNKWKNSLSKEIESHSKEIEDIKKHPIELLKLENTITEIKFSADRLNSTMKGAEENNQWTRRQTNTNYLA